MYRVCCHGDRSSLVFMIHEGSDSQGKMQHSSQGEFARNRKQPLTVESSKTTLMLVA